MLVSRLSRIGAQMAKQLPRGICTSLFKTKHVQNLYTHYSLQPEFQLHPKSPFQGTLSEKQNNFSTAASGSNNLDGNEQKEKISVTFVDKDGEEQYLKVPCGMSMLEAAHENDIELEGACEGSLACSTCHVIVMDMEYYNKLEDPTDEENDMLDLAFGLTETSRLGCQVIAKPELDGIRLAIPAATRNFAVDGYVPKPH
ncbi:MITOCHONDRIAL FERREDOXIN 2 [Euphorbia peplus]|nr:MITOCHONDRIAL FERREDOXIN 2 [Euphorbia peplus]